MLRFAPLLLGLGLLSTVQAQTTHVVTVTDFQFSPADLVIEAGDTVMWDATEGFHNVNGDLATFPSNPEGFTSGAPANAPWTYSFTFTTPGDYDYQCDVHAATMKGTIAVTPATTDSPLLISEYVEGSSNNKAVELYNPSGSPVDLDAGDYTLQYFFNGATSPGLTVDLTGVVAPDDVFVVAHSSADSTLLAAADQTQGGSWFNGNDAVVLFQGLAVVDAIGQVGFDPGDEWGTGDTSTQNNTLRREGSSCTADADTSDVFDPAAHYTGYPQDTFDGLGSATLDCGATPDVTADIEPINPPIVVPAGGGPVPFSLTLTNTTASPQSFDFWLVLTLPSGTERTLVRRSLTLNPNQTFGPANVSVNLPGGAPAGTYTMTLNVGMLPATVEDSDSFTFEKAAPSIASGRAASEAVALTLSGDLPGDPSGVAPATAEARSGEAAGVVTYPNPVMGQSTFRFTLDAAAEVRLALYDALGREVAVLVDGPVEAGVHEAAFDASGLPSGVYVWRLVAGERTQSGRLTLVR